MSSIDYETLQEWLSEGRPVVVLDVRAADDRAEWAIPGSLHIDAYTALKQRRTDALDALQLSPGSPVVAVCNAGKVSLTAAELLAQQGLESYSLVGGMRSWSLAWNTAELNDVDSAADVVQVRRTGKGCLSYLVGCEGQAAAIDASLDPSIYLRLAHERGWRITSVLDTHIHADHLSRSRALAEQSGATLYLPSQSRVTFPFRALHDGDTVVLGSTRLTALHTPGHTAESTCYLLDRSLLFTGDTLFLGAVGRPDLHADPQEAQQRAAALHTSLQRLRALGGELRVLPGHTSEPVPFDRQPISACLADVAARIELLQLGREAFVAALLARIPPTPPNHRRVTELNEAGLLVADPVEIEAGANRCAAP